MMYSAVLLLVFITTFWTRVTTEQKVWYSQLPDEKLTGVPKDLVAYEKDYKRIKTLIWSAIGKTGETDSIIQNGRRRQVFGLWVYFTKYRPKMAENLMISVRINTCDEKGSMSQVIPISFFIVLLFLYGFSFSKLKQPAVRTSSNISKKLNTTSSSSSPNYTALAYLPEILASSYLIFKTTVFIG